MKKFLKRFFLGLGALLLLLVVGVASLAGALWVKPELLLNEKMFRLALRWAPPEWKISWTKLDLRFEKLNWSSKRTLLTLENFCAVNPLVVDTCVADLNLDLSFSLRGLKPKVTRIDRLEAKVAHLTLKASTAEEEKQATGPLPDLRAPDFTTYYPEELDLAKLGQVNLQLRKLRLESKDGPPLLAQLLLEKAIADRPSFFAAAEAIQGKTLDLRVSAHIDLAPQMVSAEGEIDAKAAGWKVRGPLDLRWGKSLNLKANLEAQGPKQSYKTNIILAWTPENLKLNFNPLVVGDIWPGARLRFEDCLLQSRFDRKSGYPAANSLNCNFSASAREQIPVLEKITGFLKLNLELEPKKNLVAAKFSLEEATTDSFLDSQTKGQGEAILDLANGSLVSAENLELHLTMKAPQFERWVKGLRLTEMAVPAPLHTLSGPIELKLDLENGTHEEMVANLTLASDLKGAWQALVTQSEGKITLSQPLLAERKIDIEARTVLQEVRLEAPPLRLEEPPRFLPDKRFTTVAEEAKKEAQALAKNPIRWNLKVDTVSPILIATDIMESPVPLVANLDLNQTGRMKGFVQVDPMPLQVFSKKAEVERVRVSYQRDSDLGELDGVIVHRTPEVVVRILLLGSTDSPRVEFQSDPPLSRQQIISVLLFNKSLAELTEEEVSSTQNMSQALSDGAFGLFSLVFLSSTPIQSIGYDPVSQSYSARVRIDNKTTVGARVSTAEQGEGETTVGSEMEATRQFSVRRRLGNRWAIRTELQQRENSPDAVLTLLEWFRRF